MKKQACLAALSLVAAVAIAQSPETAAETTPACADTRKCEVMWSRAQDAVAVVSNMRIRLMTDSRIETFPPTRYGSTGAVVTKVPVGESGYEIKIQIECYRSVDCSDLQRSGRRLFNMMVGG